MTEAELQELRALREQVHRLEAVVAGLESAQAPERDRGAPHSDPVTSRRALLRSLAGAGAGAALGASALAVIAAPAGATQDQPVIAGQDNTASGPTVVIRGSTPSGASSAALVGLSAAFAGVAGISDGATGVVGSSASGTGVDGTSFNGTAVSGESTNATGVSGTSGAGVGVRGYGAKVGVEGATFTGIGGRFAGAQAAIQLVPRGSVGRPTSGAHQRGELICDALGALYVCTANGTPGTWRRITVA
jgi:hypothetical protein